MMRGIIREKQNRYLSQALQLEEVVNPHIALATMMIVSTSVFFFLIWAGFTDVSEVSHTPGEVVPSGYQQSVQHLEGGMISSILVHEGDVVEKDEILLVLSAESIREDLEKVQSRQLFLNLQAERLRAYLENRKPNFSSYPEAGQEMIADQIEFFDGMIDARNKEARIIQDQVNQKVQAIEILKSDLSGTQKNFGVIDDIYQKHLKLNAQGYSSDLQLLEERKRRNDVMGEMESIKRRLISAQSEVEEFKARLSSLEAQNRDDTHQDLAQVLSEIDQNKKVIDKINERIGRLKIRSPVKGLVKGLSVNTIGEIIQPGQTIMEIVPLEGDIEVLVKISPKDIGHLAIGQPVRVKFSTYDFSRYGSVPGELERISATTFEGDNGERYYEGKISLSQNYVGDNPDNSIFPGMTVMADIITGNKTLLEYMLKPVKTSTQTAFSER